MIIRNFTVELLEQSKQKLLHVLHSTFPLYSFSFKMNELSWSFKEGVVLNVDEDTITNIHNNLESFVNGFVSGVRVYHTWF